MWSYPRQILGHKVYRFTCSQKRNQSVLHIEDPAGDFIAWPLELKECRLSCLHCNLSCLTQQSILSLGSYGTNLAGGFTVEGPGTEMSRVRMGAAAET